MAVGVVVVGWTIRNGQGCEGDQGRNQVDRGFGSVGQQADRAGQQKRAELERHRDEGCGN